MLLCLVCLFAFACFFLSSFSHLSLKHVCISYYNYKKISGNLPRMDVCISYYNYKKISGNLPCMDVCILDYNYKKISGNLPVHGAPVPQHTC